MEKQAAEGDLHLIMMAVQKLVDEMLPPDDDGVQDHTPTILDRMQGVQDTVCKTLGLPIRPLIAPDA
jgi:hypothetical protein